jgi:heme/copper-type cytochrome/quinol oxidase subunit 3
MQSSQSEKLSELFKQSAHMQMKKAGKMYLARVWLASEVLVFSLFSRVYINAQRRVLTRPHSLLTFQFSVFAGQS